MFFICINSCFFYICKNVFILITAFQFFNLKQSILMKIYLSTLLSLLLPLGFMACSSDDEPGKTPDVPAPQIQLTEIERTGVSSFNNFGLSLLGTIADDTRYGDDKNVSISPVSAAFVLSMIASGCDAGNADAISQAMGCTDPKQMAALSAKLLGHFAKPRSMQLMTANAMWYIDRYKLNSDYVSTLKQDFASHIVPVSDFSQSTVNDINSWISEMTKGNIPEFITSIDADQPALWINTLYAKGKWKLKFPKKRTNREIFHGTKGDIEVDMMHQTDIFNYKALENCEVIRDEISEGRRFCDIYSAASAGRHQRRAVRHNLSRIKQSDKQLLASSQGHPLNAAFQKQKRYKSA